MHNDLAPDDWNERYRLARIDAREGYGWNDLIVRYGLSETVAKMLVIEAEGKRIADQMERET